MPVSYEFNQISHHELQNYYPNLWETIKKEFSELTINEWAKIASLVLGTCSHCHDNKKYCRCMFDE